MIDAEKTLSLIVPTVSDNVVGKLILEIEELNRKLGSADKQSFYFLLALPTHKRKLVGLAKRYETYRREVNQNTKEHFLQRLVEARKNEECWKVKYSERPNLINRIALRACGNEISELQSLIDAKKRFGYLPDLAGDIFLSRV
jgi:hypothetical protein